MNERLIVDCDVHAYNRNGLRDVLPYMSKAWEERFKLKGLDLNEDALSFRFANPHEGGALRRDALPPRGGPPGSDPQHLVRDHLDRYDIRYALLSNLQILGLAAVQAQPDESIALCSAFNDLHIQEWLPVEDRFLYGAVIPAQDPIAAAKEVRRVAEHDRVVAIYFPLIEIPMGNRFFHPLYDACEETGLPLVLHPSSTDFIYQGAAVNPAGWAESYAEFYANLPVVAWSTLSSLIMTGTLERFPRLRVLVTELGFSWVVPAMWRLDKAWESCRFEVPWVKRPPREYVRSQVRFGTQPLDEPADVGQLEQVVDMLGEEMLLFCSDYPHWDGDAPDDVLQGMAEESRRRILAGNALDVLPIAPATEVPVGA
jgi:uncharacterized protein